MGAGDAQQEFAGRAPTGLNHPFAVTFTQRTLAGIQPQLGLTALFIGTVAVETLVGEDRTDVAIEVHLSGPGGRAAQC